MPITVTRLPGTTFSVKFLGKIEGKSCTGSFIQVYYLHTGAKGTYSTYLSQYSCMWRGISPLGTASGSSCSLMTWKSTHLHLSGMIKNGSRGQGGRPLWSLQQKNDITGLISSKIFQFHIGSEGMVHVMYNTQSLYVSCNNSEHTISYHHGL